MAVYAIGDVQGCFDELLALLTRIDFDRARDRLWMVGDLVNRGPRSLEVLRFVAGLGDRVVCVLGNHDLHLLAVAAGVGKLNKADRLDEVLAAPDLQDLVRWLRHRPLLHHDPALGYTMVHAGLAPAWTLQDSLHRAHEVEQALRGPSADEFFTAMYGEEPTGWRDDLTGLPRLRAITDFLTRARFLDRDGRCDLVTKGQLGSQPVGHVPWFDFPGRATADLPIIFGHWSALGSLDRPNLLALDTGCLWGGCLTAARLDGRGEIFQVDCSAKHHLA